MAKVEDALSFPDEARGELDHALAELVDRAGDVLKTQGRLRALIRANQAVVEQLDLEVVLERIVTAAVQLVGAEYGALGVIAPGGGLEQFINVGMTPEQITAIGPLPQGHGILGALIDEPHPIRLDHLSDDPRSAGFPVEHPPMDSFLGVPVRVRGEVYGNLYLSNQSTGLFTREDEQLVESLAATAGFAIDNARLFAETKRRQAWSAASAEITAALLSAEQGDSITIVVSRVLLIADADLACVIFPTPDPDELIIGTIRGLDQGTLAGTVVKSAGSLSQSVLEARQPRLVNDGMVEWRLLSNGRELGPIMAVPLLASGTAEGVLLVGRLAGRARFSPADLEMAANFAGQAAVAMELGKARSAQQRMLLLEDRGRIARDLHDNVIQQLFGTGLELQSIAGALAPSKVATRVSNAVGNLDIAINQIRTAIFALSSSDSSQGETVRHRLIDLAGELALMLGHTPRVEFAGPVDVVIIDGLADDLMAVARESLTNVAKHAAAHRSSVVVSVSSNLVTLEVADDGTGYSDTGRRSGLANLTERAELRGGSCTFVGTSNGCRLTWSVPFELEPVVS